MVKSIYILATAYIVFFCVPVSSAISPWGASYFPNVPLITHDGETVHFFDDLIKDKIVAINFIYTSCPDSCPLETAKLAKVQNILGDRMDKDVFFYSISIDPENDTPAVLKKYRERFGAHWKFLTGKKSDIDNLRRKLGLYIKEIQDGSNNHNLSLIIGNQTTGRWMKRGPFENPYVLADQLGNWLTGWKSALKGDSYANAPKLRNISRGEQIFRTRCTSCHSLTGKELPGALGPDLLGVTERREMQWLLDWMKAPNQMLKKKDPVAMALYKQYNNLAMPNMRLHKDDVLALIKYMNLESQRQLHELKQKNLHDKSEIFASSDQQNKPIKNVLTIMNAWIREAHPDAKANAGYMRLINVSSKKIELAKFESEVHGNIEVHEMVKVNGLLTMQEVTDLIIPANSNLQFSPNGKHLMLMNPRDHRVAGQKIDITMVFKSGKKQIVPMRVLAN